jgi:hypothetical protein
MDYSLFIMVAVLVMLEMQPGMALTAFPPPDFAGSASILWFSCFSTASSQERLGGSLYSGF